jgi:hypothetical protein
MMKFQRNIQNCSRYRMLTNVEQHYCLSGHVKWHVTCAPYKTSKLCLHSMHMEKVYSLLRLAAIKPRSVPDEFRKIPGQHPKHEFIFKHIAKPDSAPLPAALLQNFMVGSILAMHAGSTAGEALVKRNIPYLTCTFSCSSF